MIKKVKDKLKFILPLTILILMFMLETLSMINNQYSQKKGLEITKNKIFLVIKLSNVLHETQKERGMAVGFVSSRGVDFKNELKLQQSITDKEIQSLYAYLDKNNLTQMQALKSILQLKKLRLSVNKLLLSSHQTLTQYTSINSKILKLILKITKTLNLNKLSQNLVAYVDFLYLEENAGIERALGIDILSSKVINKDEINKFHTLIVKQNVYQSAFYNYAGDSFIKYYKRSLKELATKRVEMFRSILLSEEKNDIDNLNAKVWFKTITQKINSLKVIDNKLSKYIIFYVKDKLSTLDKRLSIMISVNLVSILIYLFIIYLILNFIKENNRHKDLISKYIIVSTTDTRGIITDASEAFLTISGYKRGELIGKPHKIVRHPDIPKEAFKDLWSTIKSGKVWSGTIKNKKKDGAYYWVDTRVEPIFNKSGKIISYMAVRQNITDKIELDSLNQTLEKKVQSEVKKNREKDKAMLQQSRLAQMGEMMSMIAHQWRQPLTAISATSGNLTLKAKLDMLDNDTAIELGEKISDYSQHLSATIDDFRDFFKPNKESQETTYKELIKSVLSIVESSLKNQDIKLIQEFHSDATLSTHPNEIKQVILNLVKNAEDILLEKEIENPTITIETENNILRVKNNAGGVPEDIIGKIFNPYFSTKTKKDGTGLGLYMSKTIIEEHCGGELRVYNDADGAVFEITLPFK